MTSYVSQCPNCDTSFKVTDSQLAAAEGAVRCGACLEVFIASDYFVEAPIPDLFETEATGALSTDPETSQQGLNDEDAVVRQAQSPEAMQAEDSSELQLADDSAAPTADELNLDSVSETPVEELVGEAPPTEAPERRWLLLAIVASIVLSGQYLWFERERLSANPTLRPYYLSLCGVTGCELPDYHDPSTLYTTELLVRSHPENSQGLTVDAILRNEAAYRQRFPLLELSFSNIDGTVIASREFPPSTYLGGEMAGLRYIPAVTEVRLSLDIVDPGADAVSYRMRTIFD